MQKFLTDNQNRKNALKQKHFSLNVESSGIEVLRKIFFKTLFSVCLYFKSGACPAFEKPSF